MLMESILRESIYLIKKKLKYKERFTSNVKVFALLGLDAHIGESEGIICLLPAHQNLVNS